MEIIRCENGHFYDKGEYRSCPRCEQERSGAASNVSSGILGTEAFGDFTGRGTSSGYIHTDAFVTGGNLATEPVNPVKKPGAYPVTTPAYNKVNTMPKTETVNPVALDAQGAAKAAVKPVVGWLVCIEGPAKGKDYRIVDQNNFVGRNADMEISIPEDATISADKSAVIAYDFKSRSFYFGLVSGHNMVTINDRIVFSPEKVQAYDVLGIGNSRFIFIPLCGEKFDWHE